MPRQVTTNHGKIVYTDELIATIAGIAATECYGIVGMASRKLKDGIAELLGQENITRGVVVTTDDQLKIDLYVIVGYGTRISQVAQNVMDNVTYAVKDATGLHVGEVAVHIQGVRVGNQ